MIEGRHGSSTERYRLCPDHRRAARARDAARRGDRGEPRGLRRLVADPRSFPIEIVRWPAQGWRPVDENSGDQGGVTEGLFEFALARRDPLRAQQRGRRQLSVRLEHLAGGSCGERRRRARERALIWRANYHPDGGQLIYPTARQSFVVPLALPGDDVTPERFISFWCDGTRGLYIHPNVWHGAFVPHDDHASSSIARAASTPACRSISPRSSAATSALPLRRRLRNSTGETQPRRSASGARRHRYRIAFFKQRLGHADAGVVDQPAIERYGALVPPSPPAPSPP